jgi:hypothetical protein
MAILQDVSKSNGKAPTNADLMAQLEALKAENQRLRETKHKALSFKASEKGCLSCYGLGRFPISLYKSQWIRLIQAVDQIKQALEDYGDKLTTKD